MGSKAARGAFISLTNGLYTSRHETGRRVAWDAIRGEAMMMVPADSAQTSATLQAQVRDWGDQPAWDALFEPYHLLLRLWCRGFAFAGDDGDELCQRIWIELMARMRTFRYDPGRGFRRWLWRLFRSETKIGPGRPGWSSHPSPPQIRTCPSKRHPARHVVALSLTRSIGLR
jgi:Sigma-70 region 2